MSSTITNKVLMVRPKNFGYNAETAENNNFQDKKGSENHTEIQAAALAEFDNMVSEIRRHDIEVIVIEDTASPTKHDAIFPNNWFSTHENGHIITYPMFAESRRAERREDIVDQLTESYGYTKRYGFEYNEEDELYLEGTGSMIIDRTAGIIYACLSPRTDIQVLEKFAVLEALKKVIFHARDTAGELIYHTNVMMALGVDIAVICLDTITDMEERQEVIGTLENSGKKIIEISIDQMNQFAGNMLQVKSKLGEKYLIMSQAAYDSLTINQIDAILPHTKIISIPIPTIEKYGGGSVRCMMAEIFVPK